VGKNNNDTVALFFVIVTLIKLVWDPLACPLPENFLRVSQFIDHLSEDVLPPLLERLSSKEDESERGN
jgi:hypothetical protein